MIAVIEKSEETQDGNALNVFLSFFYENTIKLKTMISHTEQKLRDVGNVDSTVSTVSTLHVFYRYPILTYWSYPPNNTGLRSFLKSVERKCALHSLTQFRFLGKLFRRIRSRHIFL